MTKFNFIGLFFGEFKLFCITIVMRDFNATADKDKTDSFTGSFGRDVRSGGLLIQLCQEKYLMITNI